MSPHRTVVIVGGHGRIALLAAPKLAANGWNVSSLIRNPDHAQDVADAQATPVVLDIEHESQGDLEQAFESADAVVFSAGAGGGDPQRTRAVDYEGAVRVMRAAESAGVKRFVMVSYASPEQDVERLDPSDGFYTYALAKRDADAQLRDSSLDYTILGPGLLTTDPGTGTILVSTEPGAVNVPAEQRVTSRENVASVIAAALDGDEAQRATVNFFEGPTPISEALSALS